MFPAPNAPRGDANRASTSGPSGTLCPNRPGQLVAVGGADDDVTLKPGVGNLASHVSVGAPHDHPELNQP